MEKADRLELLRAVLDALGAGDTGALIDLYTDDYVIELPYADSGTIIEGRDAALALVAAAFDHVRFEFTITEVHPSADPDLVIVECTSEGKFVRTGEPFHNRYISLWWFRGNRVCRTREFFNPLAATSVLESVTPPG
jgi:uncharacterized protein